MFKHILLPTDGSRFSERAVFCGVEMARRFGARVTGIYAAPEFHILSYRVAALSESREQFAAACHKYTEDPRVKAAQTEILADQHSRMNELGLGALAK